jgi:four helix bundle protein
LEAKARILKTKCRGEQTVRRFEKENQELCFKGHSILYQIAKQRKEVGVLGNQLLRLGTSVAAHAREASRARSDSEFCSKLYGLLQEADESALWLELLRDDCSIRDENIGWLYQETGELMGIFTTMVAKLRKRNG